MSVHDARTGGMGSVPERDTRTASARWSRLAVLGLLMIAAAGLVFLLASLAWGLDVGEQGAFLLATVLLPSIAAFLVLRFGTWARIVAIVVALLAVAGLFWTAFGVAEPGSFFDFVPGILVIPGALITIAAAIASIVAARRGHVGTGEGERRVIRVVLVVLAVLIAMSGLVTLTTRTTVDASEADAEVVLEDFAFTGGPASLAGGSKVAVRNTDPFHHTFTIEELDVDVSLGPGSSELVQIPDEPGTYVLFCRPHTVDPDSPNDDDMWTELTIE